MTSNEPCELSREEIRWYQATGFKQRQLGTLLSALKGMQQELSLMDSLNKNPALAQRLQRVPGGRDAQHQQRLREVLQEIALAGLVRWVVGLHLDYQAERARQSGHWPEDQPFTAETLQALLAERIHRLDVHSARLDIERFVADAADPVWCEPWRSWLDHGLIGADALETGFVVLTGVGALLHLDHLSGFKHLKAMAAVGEEDHVTGFEDAAFEVGLVVVVEVDPHTAGFDEQHLLGVLHLARYGVVDVGRDDVALGAVHVAELLGEVAGGEELDAIGSVCSAKQNSQNSTRASNFIKHSQFPE